MTAGTSPRLALGSAEGAIRARAILLGERLPSQGFESEPVVSVTPLGLRIGERGFVALFRYGVVVLVGLEAADEEAFLARIAPRVVGPVSPREEETLLIRPDPAQDDGLTPAGLLQLRELSAERFAVVADVLAKSVALARAEREVANVFDTVEPITQSLMTAGTPPPGRRSFLRLIGSALTTQHRLSGRVAVREKPDNLWERPDLERLYSRLEDEYELVERAETLDRNLQVIGTTVTAMIDLQDTARAVRLEVMVVVLILIEVALSLLQLYLGLRG